jgi:hypothetical protein
MSGFTESKHLRDGAGRFAEKTYSEADGDISFACDARPSAGVVDALPYEVPDLNADQQEETGLPANFDEAFDAHFAEASEALERRNGDVSAVEDDERNARNWSLSALESSFPQATGRIRLHAPDDDGEEGWYVSSEPGARTTEITYGSFEYEDGGYGPRYSVDGPSLTTNGAKAREHVATARHHEETAQRATQLAAMRHDREAPWAFLPTTWRQKSRADNVTDHSRRELSDIRRRERLRGDYERARDQAEPYEGMSEDEIRTAARENYRAVEVKSSWTARIEKGFVHKSGISADGSRTLPAIHAMYFDDEIDNNVESIRRARTKRDELAGRVADFPSAEEDTRARQQAKDKAEQYRRYRGWPGGDIGPQQDRKGVWYHLVPGKTIHEDRFEELPPR